MRPLEVGLTAAYLTLAIPGAALDVVLIADRALHGEIGADYGLTGALERWWGEVTAGYGPLGDLLWLAAAIAGAPVAIAFVAAPGLLVAWLLYRFDRPTGRGSGRSGR